MAKRRLVISNNNELSKALKAKGFKIIANKCTGSHQFWTDGVQIARVPVHGSGHLNPRTAQKLVKQYKLGE